MYYLRKHEHSLGGPIRYRRFAPRDDERLRPSNGWAVQPAGGYGGEVLTGLYGKVTTEALESAAASGGPTVQVFTRLTQAPAVGKTLSVAYDKAGAMAARSAGELYKAELPRALVDQLKRSGLAFEKKLVWEGGKKVHTELQIMPQATKFVTQYFK